MNKATAVDWPIAEFMAHACGMLGIQNVLEVSWLSCARSLPWSSPHFRTQPMKSHPKDWENPGRVKVLLREDGKLVNPAIKNSAVLRALSAAHC